MLCSKSLLLLCFMYVLSRSVMSNSVTPWTVARQDPLSMGIPQARIPEWVAMPSSRGSSQPKDRTQVSRIAGRFFTVCATREDYFMYSICFCLLIPYSKFILPPPTAIPLPFGNHKFTFYNVSVSLFLFCT